MSLTSNNCDIDFLLFNISINKIKQQITENEENFIFRKNAQVSVVTLKGSKLPGHVVMEV